MRIIPIVTHGRPVLRLARKYGWLPGARYTNLRDLRGFDTVGLIDIEWRRYSFKRHLDAVRATRPWLTICQDLTHPRQLVRVLDQAAELRQYAEHVAVVPKHRSFGSQIASISSTVMLGFSVPSKYGKGNLGIEAFSRATHLLGGRPDRQRELARIAPVVSYDCNRFTLDAAYGDYFDGETFRPHPVGGYKRCLAASLENINALWVDYLVPRAHMLKRPPNATA
jgi:hypothetical protein